MSNERDGTPEGASVIVDAAAAGEAISPYIFSQFIEHLGQCIYGGIWAEMLDDRKFHDAVGQGVSPWSAIGDPAAVCMDTADPFVGEHTPCVCLPGGAAAGIAQGGLTLVAGRDYVGRLWMAGDASAGPVTVSLVWGGGDGGRQSIRVSPIGGEYVKVPLRFTAGADTGDGRLEISSEGSGRFLVGTASLMPADNVRGMRPDTLAALRELDSPLYRWPGGNFVSGYDWRDGIGDPDRRPPRKNPAWRGVEHNDFGIHEFLDFCRELGTEPLIVVNTGFGDSYSAVQELEYVNGTPDTPMGQWRSRNGHREPWAVKWWGIGNEMFGPWQLGFMAPEQYVVKHNDFERRMRKADPSIRTIGVGEAGPWSEAIMKGCADHMDVVSEHFYCKDKADVPEHVAQIPDAIRAKVDAHRRYRAEFPELAGKDIRIAMDEWNYWYGPEPFGELGVRYFWKDGLGIAAGLHEYYRQSDMVEMANYAQTVNVLGCIKTTPTTVALETTGEVLKLYRQHYGQIPVAVTGAPAPLDVAAALTADRRALTVAIVNPTAQPATVPLQVCGVRLAATGRRFEMASDDPMALNDPGAAPSVPVREEAIAGAGAATTVKPYSVTLCVFDVAE